ncbi:MAG: ysh1 [Dehalococcoidia bacterium]|nr:ysh1 [Dehalococcoidia bacterium]
MTGHMKPGFDRNAGVSLTFLGGAQTVTGSRFLLSVGESRYLFDCGLFQGPRQVRELNWQPFPIDPDQLNAVVLTHAHLDHSGYLPLLAQGKRELPVYASEATAALLGILLPDAGYLQEEEARYANKKGYSRHRPALPLFTAQQATEALKSLVPIPMDTIKEIGEGVSIRMRPAGHILGSAIVECVINQRGRPPCTVVFSGDLGRFGQEFMKAPTLIQDADYVVVESTYGDREHPAPLAEESLEFAVLDTYRRNGVLLIPSFAVGRAQEVLYHLRRLEDKGKVPVQPVYIDSPMATTATDIYCRFGDEHNLGVNLLMDESKCPLRCRDTRFTRDVEESKALNVAPRPFIVITASGMCEGGRVMHHLKHRLADPRNTVLLVGFQAKGTRGRLLRDGASSLTIHGEAVPVQAQVASLESFSAHGDRHDLLRWLEGFQRPPKMTFVVHGEHNASESLRVQVQERLGWPVQAPERLASLTLE